MPGGMVCTLALVVDRLVYYVGVCSCVCVFKVYRGETGKSRSEVSCVGRNPIETPAFVDERKSLSIVGRFYLRGPHSGTACAGRAQTHRPTEMECPPNFDGLQPSKFD